MTEKQTIRGGTGMTWRRLAGPLALLACCGTVAACGSTDSPSSSDDTAGEKATATATAAESKTGEQSKFFVQADYDKQLAQRSATPEGPADQPWLQMIDPEMVDTSKYKAKSSSGWNVCFSNAASDNPWRQNGLITMKEEAKNTKEIGKFTVVDAEAKDDKQISDIEAMVSGGKCDLILIAPNTTATLTPGRRGRMQERRPGPRLRPRRPDRLPGHVHPPDRRLRLRCRRRRVPGRARSRRAARCSPCASCRAWTCSRPAGRAPRASSTRPA